MQAARRSIVAVAQQGRIGIPRCKTPARAHETNGASYTRSAERSRCSKQGARGCTRRQPMSQTVQNIAAQVQTTYVCMQASNNPSYTAQRTYRKQAYKPNIQNTSATHSCNRGHWRAQARQTTKVSQAQSVVARTVLTDGQRCAGGLQHDPTH